MKLAARLFAGRRLLFAAIIIGCGPIGLVSAPAEAANAPDATAGQRMYREGIRPSGEPLSAIVAGDVPILGTQFSCASCHGRSGMGASEGAYIVPAIAGPLLFAASPQPKRPAYDYSSLGRALRDGQDPSGRALNPLMPRFLLSDDEVASLAVYLQGLSIGGAPGTDDKVIRFATVISADVSPELRADVIAVLDTFIEEKNRQTRLESERWDRGSTPASILPTVYREWELDLWTLEGPSDGWGEQLEQNYQGNPVFALLGGLSPDSWGPIGRFCERREIPCLFPGTDLPEAEEADFYTMYFSRGLELEADLIANHLAEQQPGPVIQVYCGAAPARAAARLQSVLGSRAVAVVDLEFDCRESLDIANLAARVTANPSSTVVFWLRREQIAGKTQSLPLGRVYFSSTLLGHDLDRPLLSAPGPAFLVHPFRLPGKSDAALRRFTLWARTRDIEVRHPRFQAGAFFACLVAVDSVKHLDKFLVRDYVLDMLEHAQGMAIYMPIYPRPTFGPKQRFVTKGGYVLPVVDGQPDTKDAAWILP